MLVAVITYQFDRLIFVHGTTSNFPSVGLRFRERRVTLANATLDGSFPRAYLARKGNAT